MSRPFSLKAGQDNQENKLVEIKPKPSILQERDMVDLLGGAFRRLQTLHDSVQLWLDDTEDDYPVDPKKAVGAILEEAGLEVEYVQDFGILQDDQHSLFEDLERHVA
jgi:hypothetical protein